MGAVEFQRVRDQARPFTDLAVAAIEEVTGRRPELSTTGGTSDARFIASYCPVIEFGLVGQTMHQIDERTPVADLEKLTKIYRGNSRIGILLERASRHSADARPSRGPGNLKLIRRDSGFARCARPE